MVMALLEVCFHFRVEKVRNGSYIKEVHSCKNVNFREKKKFCKNIELWQDAHHFDLDSFAGVLCVVMASLSFI